ncbi:hypothetical protein [Salinimicrobium soli]|uniref:hypothetical protein n=1 Tax=Salinimicrobium soli TaxID=1254399 RepID=UPI003AAAD58A
MPYVTTWNTDGIIWTFSDDVSAEEISRANAEFYADERSDSSRFQIIDAAQVKSVEWNDNHIAQTAAHDIGADRRIRHVKVAYIAKETEIVSKLEKYVELSRRLNSSWQFKGFSEMEAALEWATSEE